jgi:hypothetical protein
MKGMGQHGLNQTGFRDGAGFFVGYGYFFSFDAETFQEK